MTNSSSTSTKRATAFRDRLGGQGIKRWEIFASEQTRASVREIAAAENLSAGVAAEALLSLGIEAYRSTNPTPQAASAAPGAAAQPLREISASEFADMQAQLAGPSALAADLGGPLRSMSALGVHQASPVLFSAASARAASTAAPAYAMSHETFGSVSGSLAAYSSRLPTLSASPSTRPANPDAASVLAAAAVNSLLKKA